MSATTAINSHISRALEKENIVQAILELFIEQP